MSSLNETVTAVQAVDVPSGLVPEGLSSFIVGVSSNGLLGIGLFILLLSLSVVLHRLNMERTYRYVVESNKKDNDLLEPNKGADVSRDKLRKMMFISQGSNFNAAALTAWMLLFTAFAYFYFLTPELFPRHNYYQIPSLSSGPFGFMTFGFVILLIAGLVAAFIPKELYSYYEFSRKAKIAIMLTVPILALSIALSIQLGTIFPQVDSNSRMIAFLALFASEVILLSPICAEALGGIR